MTTSEGTHQEYMCCSTLQMLLLTTRVRQLNIIGPDKITIMNRPYESKYCSLENNLIDRKDDYY